MSIKKLINYGILKVKSDMGYCLDALPNSQNYTTAVKELGIVIEDNGSIELRWTVTPTYDEFLIFLYILSNSQVRQVQEIIRI